MVDYTWLRHRQRLDEIEALARERALARTVRDGLSTRSSAISLRRRIGFGLMRIGALIAAEARA